MSSGYHNNYQGQHMKPAPQSTIIDKKEEYEVKESRKYRKCGREMQYLVHWKDYKDEHN